MSIEREDALHSKRDATSSSQMVSLTSRHADSSRGPNGTVLVQRLEVDRTRPSRAPNRPIQIKMKRNFEKNDPHDSDADSSNAFQTLRQQRDEVIRAKESAASLKMSEPE